MNSAASARNAIFARLPGARPPHRRRVQGDRVRLKNDRPERKKVMALAQARKVDAILVTELSRWGRST